MGVPEPAGHRDRSGAEQPGRVRVALLVGEGVVPPVVGDPGDHWPLEGRTAQDRQRDTQAAPALKERCVKYRW
jgi:hypothetical protein